ncbi:hypothetical protein PR202_gb29575 [Eleusine coracana subsp. coracana]|uniref:Uncharacterized protein n=1 Tax=Eleusine coracana subsp. coracana TaxID=191504 RepID=A0AAV5FZQ2_ELECO|nr:hypothetical protein PR202_gb29575 [Eleusine coracana subsp. coracana]
MTVYVTRKNDTIEGMMMTDAARGITTTDDDVTIRIGATIVTRTINDVTTLTSTEGFDGINAFVPELHICKWLRSFKQVAIHKYDNQTNPQEWLQIYSTIIRSARGDAFVMANYLLDYLELAVRIWLTSLPKKSTSSWGDFNKKFIEKFQATYNRPSNRFDLT